MKFTKDYMDFGGEVYFYDKIAAMPNTKENAILHYLAITCRSWTFGRMTKQERERCVTTFLWSAEQGLIKGDFQARWDTMQAIYAAFLAALGYDDDPYYRDELGIVEEFIGEEYAEIDFCGGFVYFTGSEEDEDGNLIERKIPLSALVRITN